MEKKMIISGDPKTIGFIVQENRIRIERGDVKFIEINPKKEKKDIVGDGKDNNINDKK